MNNLKMIASLVSNSADTSLSQLLRQFVSDNEYIYYGEFQKLCESKGEAINYNEFLDLLDAEELYLFNEYSHNNRRYWTATLEEGYVSNSLPGDWDDFGDDQIEGITSPSFGDGGQSQPIEFEPLSNEQISDDPNSEQVPEEPEDEPNPPDFDTRIRHRPSRSVKELESKEPGAKLVEHDNQTDNHGPMISRLYGLVDSWQTGAMDQSSFETELNKMSEEPTLSNSSVKIWPMVQKILTARAEKAQ